MITSSIKDMLKPGDVLMEHKGGDLFLHAYWDGETWSRPLFTGKDGFSFEDYKPLVNVPEKAVEFLRHKEARELLTVSFLEDVPLFPDDTNIKRYSTKIYPGRTIELPPSRQFYVAEIYDEHDAFVQVLTPALEEDIKEDLADYIDSTGRLWRCIENTVQLLDILPTIQAGYERLKEIERFPEVFG
jgi:hypothetical protein